MFHTYITTSRGNKVDIDRASFLMDKDIFESILNERYHKPARLIDENYKVPFDRACARDVAFYNLAQRVWSEYCERHHEKYGKPFLPDVKSDWDT